MSKASLVDTVIGIPDTRAEIVMLKAPDAGTGLELSSFVRPESVPGSAATMANKQGLRNVAFEVDDPQAAVDQAAAGGYGLVGGIGEYEGAGGWHMFAGRRGSSLLAQRIASGKADVGRLGVAGAA